mmetsp:Transcript_29989/g.63232  ORF Transcript_29989/g.63232 Transcript_29989/m.63232 type:complete len:149 (-) Transcript_29989:392-838(-)
MLLRFCSMRNELRSGAVGGFSGDSQLTIRKKANVIAATASTSNKIRRRQSKLPIPEWATTKSTATAIPAPASAQTGVRVLLLTVTASTGWLTFEGALQDWLASSDVSAAKLRPEPNREEAASPRGGCCEFKTLGYGGRPGLSSQMAPR